MAHSMRPAGFFPMSNSDEFVVLIDVTASNNRALKV